MVTVANLALTLVIFIVLIGIIVFIHELGHFLAAKWAGVVVQEFAFGFGPKIIGKKWRGTEYKINWFPVGGYCKMLGDQDSSSFLRYNAKPYADQDKTYALNLLKKAGVDVKKADYNLVEQIILQQHKLLSAEDYKRLQNYIIFDYVPHHPGNFDNVSKKKRALILSAGVMMNFILGIVIYYVFFFISGYYIDVPKIGEPSFLGATVSNPPVIESFYNTDNSVADSIIIKADGNVITSPVQFQQILREKYNQPIDFYLQKFTENGYEYKACILVLNGDGYKSLFDQDLYLVPIISTVKDGSLAESLGLKSGDFLVTVNGMSLSGEKTLNQLLPKLEGQNVDLKYLDNSGVEHIVNFSIPIVEQGKTILGISYSINDPYPANILRLNYSGDKIFSGLNHAINMSIYNISGFIELIRQSISQRSVEPVVSGVSSVVGVSKVVYTLVEVKDFTNILNLAALVSLSLGMMNILPIPLFDGGHLLFLIIEKIRGKKLGQKLQEKISVVAFYLLILLSVLIIFKDILSFNFVQSILSSISSIFNR